MADGYVDGRGLSPTEAEKQAATTVSEHMGRGKKAIDGLFGEGYAAEHPELLAAFMQAASLDFVGWSIGCALAELRDAVERPETP